MSDEIKVVNLRTCHDWGKPGDIRIDRKTKWGNPFRMVDESMRDEVCNKYEKYFNLLMAVVSDDTIQVEQELINMGLHTATAMILVRDFRPNLTELKDAKRLGCWCYPRRCHGDYLKKKIEEFRGCDEQWIKIL